MNDRLVHEEIAERIAATGNVVREVAHKRANCNLKIRVAPTEAADQKYHNLVVTYTDPDSNESVTITKPRFMFGEVGSIEAIRFFRSDKLREGSRRDKHVLTLYGNAAVRADYRALHECLQEAYVAAWPTIMQDDTHEALRLFAQMVSLTLDADDPQELLRMIVDGEMATDEQSGAQIAQKWQRFICGRIRNAFPYVQQEAQTAFAKQYTNSNTGEMREGITVTLRENAPPKSAGRPEKTSRGLDRADVATTDAATPLFKDLSLTRLELDGSRSSVEDVSRVLCSHVTPAKPESAEEQEQRLRNERRPLHAIFLLVEIAQIFVLERNIYPLKYLRWVCLPPEEITAGKPRRSNLANAFTLGNDDQSMHDALCGLVVADPSLVMLDYAATRREERFRMRVVPSRNNNGYHNVICEVRDESGKWASTRNPQYVLYDTDDLGFLAFRASKYAPNATEPGEIAESATGKYSMQVFGDGDMEMQLRALYDAFIEALCDEWSVIKSGHYLRELRLYVELNIDTSIVAADAELPALMDLVRTEKQEQRWTAHLRGCIAAGFPFYKDRSACFAKSIVDRNNPSARRYGIHLTVPEDNNASKTQLRLQDVSCTLRREEFARATPVDTDDLVGLLCRATVPSDPNERRSERLRVHALVIVFDTVYCANENDTKVFPRRNLRWLCMDDPANASTAGGGTNMDYSKIV
ncbi:hypothetical protein CYMTET_52258 [Cymbomonas tetramitiformis]|uniref:Uncharacterized protein n=1 Tax=Cymbomonas tetramitiformis TaxID=36881 RepID=A0AAE0ESX8_9CHLO|nr:hypothetical protein CYMTET_52258 [Cymbomonas tetramitiformis]